MALAEQYAAEAFEAYERHDYERSIRLYELAQEAAPSADIRYNIARVYDVGLSDRPRAIEHYERFLAEPGASSARVGLARARLDALRADERASRERANAATLAQLGDIARDFPLDVPRSGPPGQRPEQPDGGLRPLETAAITLASMGLVGVGVGTGFGIAAQSRSDEWRRACEGNNCTSREGVDAAQSAARRATIATVGFAAGGGLLALGAALWLIDGSEQSDEASRVHVTPFVRAAGGGTLVSGSF